MKWRDELPRTLREWLAAILIVELLLFAWQLVRAAH